MVEYRSKFNDAIRDILAPELVTKWVVLAEGIGEDGVRGMFMYASEGALSYEIKGMILEALNAEQNRTLVDDIMQRLRADE